MRLQWGFSEVKSAWYFGTSGVSPSAVSFVSFVSFVWLVLLSVWNVRIFVDAVSILRHGKLSFTEEDAGQILKTRQVQVEPRDEKGELQPRIVGGEPAAQGAFPWYAVPYGQGLCGASVVHSDILVSAAHCAEVFANGVVLGLNTLADRNGAIADVLPVEGRYLHPEWDAKTLTHDVMLIKLGTAVPSDVPFVPYNSDPLVPADGELVTVIGFGAAEEGGNVQNNLQQVILKVISNSECSDLYWNPFFGSPIQGSVMLCAGSNVDGKVRDSCQGDSGGPMLSSDGTLLGLVSFGIGCGYQGIPGVYTRVSSVADFIQKGICALSSNRPASCTQGGSNNNNSTNNDNNANSPTLSPSNPDFSDYSSSPTSIPITMNVDDDYNLPTPTPIDFMNDDTSNGDQCNIGCTWMFLSGLVVHKLDGTDCQYVCVLMFLQSWLSSGYTCGLCPGDTLN